LNPPLPPQVQQQLQLAIHCHSQGALDSAKSLYEAVLHSAPNTVDALNNLALIESQTGRLQVATGLMRRAVALQPGNTSALNNLAYNLQQLGQTDEAVRLYRHGLASQPQDTDLRNNLGLLLKQLDRLDEALACFEDGLAQVPNDLTLQANRANVLQALGRAEEALAQYDQALALSPQHPVLWTNRARALQDLKRHGEALASCDQALASKPGHTQAWIEKGNTLRALGQGGNARDAYNQALRTNPDHHVALASLAALALSEGANEATILEQSARSLQQHLANTHGQRWHTGQVVPVAAFKLRHDLQQALYLAEHGIAVPGLRAFTETAQRLLATENPDAVGGLLNVDGSDMARMQPYLLAPVQPALPRLPHCLNPDLDWASLEADYLGRNPELLVIDGFLAPAALEAFQRYSHTAKVWHTTYANAYLGAFANQGFVTPLHLQLAQELKARMPRVFLDYALNQLWGFKYEPRMTKGINVHADFAKVNLNFWITPDEHNLDPASGGLKVYEVPAPSDWTFEQYNIDAQGIYSFLAQHQSSHVTVPHRCNRAVLFNSALFHETDTIRFAPGYQSRRINMTYLFGKQLS